MRAKSFFYTCASMCLLSCASPVVAQVVIDAEPTVRVDSGGDSTSRTVLTPVERAKARLIILKQEGRYLWASRDGRELHHMKSGYFHYFVDRETGQYVKVMDTHDMSPALRQPGPRFRFMEHVHGGLGTITYWGGVESFRLDPLH
jgi:hypothetical protein